MGALGLVRVEIDKIARFDIDRPKAEAHLSGIDPVEINVI